MKPRNGAFLTIDWLVTLVLWQRITRPASIRHVQPHPLTPQLWRHYTYEFFFSLLFLQVFFMSGAVQTSTAAMVTKETFMKGQASARKGTTSALRNIKVTEAPCYRLDRFPLSFFLSLKLQYLRCSQDIKHFVLFSFWFL